LRLVIVRKLFVIAQTQDPHTHDNTIARTGYCALIRSRVLPAPLIGPQCANGRASGKVNKPDREKDNDGGSNTEAEDITRILDGHTLARGLRRQRGMTFRALLQIRLLACSAAVRQSQRPHPRAIILLSRIARMRRSDGRRQALWTYRVVLGPSISCFMTSTAASGVG
jgi:hypothetical protein